MKKSFPAFIFALLCLFYLPVLGGLGRLIGGLQPIDPDTAGYYLLMDLPFYLLCVGSAVVMLVGSPFAIMGYLKTKPKSILKALIILAFCTLTFYGYPIYLIYPISLGILGYIAYKDVLRLSAIKLDPTENQRQ